MSALLYIWIKSILTITLWVSYHHYTRFLGERTFAQGHSQERWAVERRSESRQSGCRAQASKPTWTFSCMIPFLTTLFHTCCSCAVTFAIFSFLNVLLWITRTFCIQSYLGTRWLQTSLNPVLAAFWWEKNVSALGACSGLVALAQTCLSHAAALQEQVLHHTVACSPLISFGTGHKFRHKWMMIRRYHCIYYPYQDYSEGCLLSCSPLYTQKQIQFLAYRRCSVKRNTRTNILGKEDFLKKLSVSSVDLINWCEACSMLYIPGNQRLTERGLRKCRVLALIYCHCPSRRWRILIWCLHVSHRVVLHACSAASMSDGEVEMSLFFLSAL